MCRAVDADGDETIQRGLDKHPDDKDSTRLGVGAGGTTSSGGATDKGNEVFIMNAKNDDRTTSFFSQPGILAGEKMGKKWVQNRQRRNKVQRECELVHFPAKNIP